MTTLLERLNGETGYGKKPNKDTAEHSENTQGSLESIHRKIQDVVLEGHLDVLRAAHRGGHNRVVLQRLLERLLIEHGLEHSELTRRALVQELTSWLLGYGPLDRLLQDDSISEIMVNGPTEVYIETRGKIKRTTVEFTDSEQLTEVIRRLVGRTGRRIDASQPCVDARLPDGSRLNAVLPPLAVGVPLLTIRRFPAKGLTAEALLELGSLSAPVFEFLQAAVHARLNCLVSGGTATGKTTLLNILTGCIGDPHERLVTIEDAAELRPDHEHWVALETRPPNVEGRGEVTVQDLLRNALRMRPDRLVIGEVRGPEAYDLVQALNTGHDGSLSTVHANSPVEALDRLESMALLAEASVPASLIRRQLLSAVDLIVQLERDAAGKRFIRELSLVGAPEGREQLLPVYNYTRVGQEGRFEAQLSTLPNWAAALWQRRGFEAPVLEAGGNQQ